jgi:tetratricopeptide (TPR) repeat protein
MIRRASVRVLAGLAAWLFVASAAAQSKGPARATPSKNPAAPAAQAAASSIARLQAQIQRDPSNPQLHIELGLAYWETNDYARALSAFQRAVKTGPKVAEAHNWLGVALAGKADLPGAIAEFKQALALDPKYARAYTNLGSAEAKSGDLEAAVDAFQKALDLEPTNPSAHVNLGLALREKGDLDAALLHLRPVATANPSNAGLQYELGQTLRQSGDLPGAIAAFEKAITLEPELREGYYGLGQALKERSAASRKAQPAYPPGPADDLLKKAQDSLAQHDLDTAHELLAEAVRADDSNADAHTLLGFVLGQQRDLLSARTHLERAIALRPDSSDAHYNLGVVQWYSGAKEKGVAELHTSVTLDQACGSCYAFLGTAQRDSGDLDGARVSLQRAIAVLPPTAAVYVDLGIVYLRANELEKALGQLEAGLNLPASVLPMPDWSNAIASLRPLLAAHSGSAEAHHALGLMLGRTGADSTEVAREFREAVRLRPDYAEAYNDLGLVLLQSGDDAGAIAAMRDAVRTSPDYADAHDNLGAALTPTDAAEAIRELETAVRLAPDSVKAQYNLAMAYGASTSLPPEKQIDQLQKVIGLDPSFARARLALGKALMQHGTINDAVTQLQEAARLDPDSGEAHYQLGLALARAGRKDEASAELKKGRELIAANDRTQNASLDLADAHAALDRGDLAEAEAKVRRAMELGPPSTEAQSLLETISARRAKPESALDGYERAIRDGKYQEVETPLTQYVTDHPQDARAWYALGYSQFAQKKVGESIKSLAKSLELDVTNAEAHKILGRSLMMIGRFDVAQVEFEQGIRYNPDSAELHYNLGKLYSIQDNWEPARKAFEAALTIDPTYPEALDALGLAMEALGRDEEAVANYQKAIAINDERHGTFASPLVNMSAFYNRTGDPDKAIECARRAIALDPKSDRALFQKARADERQGRLNDAVGALNQAIAINPRASSYYYVLAGVYRNLGWMDESKKALDSFKRLERESAELDKVRRGGGSTAPHSPGQPRE